MTITESDLLFAMKIQRIRCQMDGCSYAPDANVCRWCAEKRPARVELDDFDRQLSAELDEIEQRTAPASISDLERELTAAINRRRLEQSSRLGVHVYDRDAADDDRDPPMRTIDGLILSSALFGSLVISTLAIFGAIRVYELARAWWIG